MIIQVSAARKLLFALGFSPSIMEVPMARVQAKLGTVRMKPDLKEKTLEDGEDAENLSDLFAAFENGDEVNVIEDVTESAATKPAAKVIDEPEEDDETEADETPEADDDSEDDAESEETEEEEEKPAPKKRGPKPGSKRTPVDIVEKAPTKVVETPKVPVAKKKEIVTPSNDPSTCNPPQSVLDQCILDAEETIKKLQEEMTFQVRFVETIRRKWDRKEPTKETAVVVDAKPVAKTPVTVAKKPATVPVASLNGSLADHIKEVLADGPMRVKDIVKVLEKKGIKSKSKSGILPNVNNSLTNRSDLFKKVDRGIYELA